MLLCFCFSVDVVVLVKLTLRGSWKRKADFVHGGWKEGSPDFSSF